MLRREVIDRLGGLDEDFFFFGEETDWCLRMRKEGLVIKFAPVGNIVHHGGGSVKKLNWRRDVMLTEATVRLHRKNGGMIAAMTAFLILFFFNGSRAIYWTLCSIWRGGGKNRAHHFRQVVFHSLATWPKA
jgi:GT2 family glycosyltransferase